MRHPYINYVLIKVFYKNYPRLLEQSRKYFIFQYKLKIPRSLVAIAHIYTLAVQHTKQYMLYFTIKMGKILICNWYDEINIPDLTV